MRMQIHDTTRGATVKVPLSVVSLGVTILFGVGSIWWQVYQTGNDQGKQMFGMAKDIGNLARSVARLEMRQDSAYTADDAARDNALVKFSIADHETRLRTIEHKRK